jgi:hypothetical protein
MTPAFPPGSTPIHPRRRRPDLLLFIRILDAIAGSCCLRIMGDEPSDGRIVPRLALTLTPALSLSLHHRRRSSSSI